MNKWPGWTENLVQKTELIAGFTGIMHMGYVDGNMANIRNFCFQSIRIISSSYNVIVHSCARARKIKINRTANMKLLVQELQVM